MAKNTNRAASAIAYVAALVLATGAWAAHWEIYVDNPVTYAKEIFGGDDPADLDLTLTTDNIATDAPVDVDEQTSVAVKLWLEDGQSVAADSELEVTFTLTGGIFGQAVNWTDLSAETGGDGVGSVGNLMKKGGSQQGGAAGDASVSLRVLVPDARTINGPSGGGNTGAFVRLDVKSLEGAAGLAGAGTVTVAAAMRVTSGPDLNFPTMLVKRDEVKAVTAAPDAVPPVVAVEYVRGTSNMIANSALAVTFTGAGGTTGNIDLANRAKLAAPATKVGVASLSYVKNTDAKEADGKASFSASDGAAANITVTVSGMVRDTDTVYFDQDMDGKPGAKEGLDIADGVATKSFRLSNAGSGATVYFVPDGTTNMTAGRLNASFAVEYDATSVVNPGAKTGGANLVYNGVESKARAYAIPNPGMNDIGNIRIKCEAGGTAMCTIFLDCNEQNGMGHFGELGSEIPAGATMVLQADGIAEVLEVDEWDGRLSCDVLSSNPVSVQVLVRSGNSLVNNTYISGD